MTQLTFDTQQGECLKVAGQLSVETNDLHFLETIREVAKQISRASGFVSTDNLRPIAEAMGLHPKSPNAWGAVFMGKHWKTVGRKKSALASNHYREIRVWEYVEGA